MSMKRSFVLSLLLLTASCDLTPEATPATTTTNAPRTEPLAVAHDPLIPGEAARMDDPSAAHVEVPSAENQSDDPADVEITRLIREAVVADDGLSMEAKNVTIVTRAGHVTLRADGLTEAERGIIERHATAAAGVTDVENLITSGAAAH